MLYEVITHGAGQASHAYSEEMSMKTGESASFEAHGMGAFDAIARDPELASHFSGAMRNNFV